MTQEMKKTTSRVPVLALALALVLLCTLALPFGLKAQAKTAVDTLPTKVTVTVNQTVTNTGKVSEDSVQYRMEPTEAHPDSPLPEGAENGVYTFTLKNTADSVTLPEITLPETGIYEYRIGRVKSDGTVDYTNADAASSFGFLVKSGENGGYTVEPFTCVDNKMQIVDKDGVAGVELNFELAGIPAATSAKATPVSNKAAPKAGKRAGYVNTEDPSRTIFWSVVIAVAVVGLFLLFFLKRKDKKDREEEAEKTNA